MDTILMETLAKGGIVLILTYLLIQTLMAYRAQSNRITDMLENELSRDDNPPKIEQGSSNRSPVVSPLVLVAKPPQNAANGL